MSELKPFSELKLRPLSRGWTSAIKWLALGCLLFLLLRTMMGFGGGIYSPQRNVFFEHCGQIYTDYFNNFKYSEALDPYRNTLNGRHEKPYLPFVYYVFWVVGNALDAKALSMEQLRASAMGQLSIATFFVVSLSTFVLLVSARLRNSPLQRVALLIGLLGSGTFLYAFERGNVIVATLPLVSAYLYWYRKHSLWQKELALVCLGLAAAIKVYPILLVTLLIADRRIWDTVRVAIYALLLAALPFVLLKDGFDNITYLRENLRAHTIWFLVAPPDTMLGFNPLVAKIASSADGLLNVRQQLTVAALSMTFGLFSTVVAHWLKAHSRRVLLLCCALAMTPATSGFYCGIYLLPAVVLLFEVTRFDCHDIIYLALLIPILSPYQLAIAPMSTRVLSNFSLTALYLCLITEAVAALVRKATSSARGKRQIPIAAARL